MADVKFGGSKSYDPQQLVLNQAYKSAFFNADEWRAKQETDAAAADLYLNVNALIGSGDLKPKQKDNVSLWDASKFEVLRDDPDAAWLYVMNEYVPTDDAQYSYMSGVLEDAYNQLLSDRAFKSQSDFSKVASTLGAGLADAFATFGAGVADLVLAPVELGGSIGGYLTTGEWDFDVLGLPSAQIEKEKQFEETSQDTYFRKQYESLYTDETGKLKVAVSKNKALDITRQVVNQIALQLPFSLAGPVVNSLRMATSVYASVANDEEFLAATTGQQFAMLGMNMAVEFGTEMMFGGGTYQIGLLSSSAKAALKLTGNGVAKTFAQQGARFIAAAMGSALEEASEEAIAEILETGFNAVILNDTEQKGWDTFWDSQNAESILLAGIIGGVTGGIMTGAHIFMTPGRTITRTSTGETFKLSGIDSYLYGILSDGGKKDVLTMQDNVFAAAARRGVSVDTFMTDATFAKDYTKAKSKNEAMYRAQRVQILLLESMIDAYGHNNVQSAMTAVDNAYASRAQSIINFLNYNPQSSNKIEAAVNAKYGNENLTFSIVPTRQELNPFVRTLETLTGRKVMVMRTGAINKETQYKPFITIDTELTADGERIAEVQGYLLVDEQYLAKNTAGQVLKQMLNYEIFGGKLDATLAASHPAEYAKFKATYKWLTSIGKAPWAAESELETSAAAAMLFSPATIKTLAKVDRKLTSKVATWIKETITDIKAVSKALKNSTIADTVQTLYGALQMYNVAMQVEVADFFGTPEVSENTTVTEQHDEIIKEYIRLPYNKNEWQALNESVYEYLTGLGKDGADVTDIFDANQYSADFVAQVARTDNFKADLIDYVADYFAGARWNEATKRFEADVRMDWTGTEYVAAYVNRNFKYKPTSNLHTPSNFVSKSSLRKAHNGNNALANAIIVMTPDGQKNSGATRGIMTSDPRYDKLRSLFEADTVDTKAVLKLLGFQGAKLTDIEVKSIMEKVTSLLAVDAPINTVFVTTGLEAGAVPSQADIDGLQETMYRELRHVVQNIMYLQSGISPAVVAKVLMNNIQTGVVTLQQLATFVKNVHDNYDALLRTGLITEGILVDGNKDILLDETKTIENAAWIYYNMCYGEIDSRMHAFDTVTAKMAFWTMGENANHSTAMIASGAMRELGAPAELLVDFRTVLDANEIARHAVDRNEDSELYDIMLETKRAIVPNATSLTPIDVALMRDHCSSFRLNVFMKSPALYQRLHNSETLPYGFDPKTFNYDEVLSNKGIRLRYGMGIKTLLPGVHVDYAQFADASAPTYGTMFAVSHTAETYAADKAIKNLGFAGIEEMLNPASTNEVQRAAVLDQIKNGVGIGADRTLHSQFTAYTDTNYWSLCVYSWLERCYSVGYNAEFKELRYLTPYKMSPKLGDIITAVAKAGSYTTTRKVPLSSLVTGFPLSDYAKTVTVEFSLVPANTILRGTANQVSDTIRIFVPDNLNKTEYDIMGITFDCLRHEVQHLIDYADGSAVDYLSQAAWEMRVAKISKETRTALTKYMLDHSVIVSAAAVQDNKTFAYKMYELERNEQSAQAVTGSVLPEFNEFITLRDKAKSESSLLGFDAYETKRKNTVYDALTELAKTTNLHTFGFDFQIIDIFERTQSAGGITANDLKAAITGGYLGNDNALQFVANLLFANQQVSGTFKNESLTKTLDDLPFMLMYIAIMNEDCVGLSKAQIIEKFNTYLSTNESAFAKFEGMLRFADKLSLPSSSRVWLLAQDEPLLTAAFAKKFRDKLKLGFTADVQTTQAVSLDFTYEGKDGDLEGNILDASGKTAESAEDEFLATMDVATEGKDIGGVATGAQFIKALKQAVEKYSTKDRIKRSNEFQQKKSGNNILRGRLVTMSEEELNDVRLQAVEILEPEDMSIVYLGTDNKRLSTKHAAITNRINTFIRKLKTAGVNIETMPKTGVDYDMYTDTETLMSIEQEYRKTWNDYVSTARVKPVVEKANAAVTKVIEETKAIEPAPVVNPTVDKVVTEQQEGIYLLPDYSKTKATSMTGSIGIANYLVTTTGSNIIDKNDESIPRFSDKVLSIVSAKGSNTYYYRLINQLTADNAIDLIGDDAAWDIVIHALWPDSSVHSSSDILATLSTVKELNPQAYVSKPAAIDVSTMTDIASDVYTEKEIATRAAARNHDVAKVNAITKNVEVTSTDEATVVTDTAKEASYNTEAPIDYATKIASGTTKAVVRHSDIFNKMLNWKFNPSLGYTWASRYRQFNDRFGEYLNNLDEPGLTNLYNELFAAIKTLNPLDDAGALAAVQDILQCVLDNNKLLAAEPKSAIRRKIAGLNKRIRSSVAVQLAIQSVTDKGQQRVNAWENLLAGNGISASDPVATKLLSELHQAVLEKDYNKINELEKQLMLYSAAATPKLRTLIFNKSQRDLGRALHLFARKTTSWRYMAMLSSPATWLRNFNSNMLIMAMNEVTESFAPAMGKIVEKLGIQTFNFKITAKRYHRISQIKPETREIIENRLIKNGRLQDSLVGGKYSWGDTLDDRVLSSMPFKNKWLGKAYSVIFGIMEEGDKIFVAREVQLRLAQLLESNFEGAYKKMGTEAFDAMYNRALSESLEVYLRSENKFSKFISNISRSNPGIEFLFTAIMPFPKVAANITKWIYESTPLSLFSLIKDVVNYKEGTKMVEHRVMVDEIDPETGSLVQVEKVWTDIKDPTLYGENTAADIARRTLKMATGTFWLIVGALAGVFGWIDYDEDDYGNMTLQLGDLRITLDALNPALSGLIIGSAFTSQGKKNDSRWDTLWDVWSQATVFSTFDDVLGFNDTFADVMVSAGGSYMLQYIPSVIKSAAKVIDPAKKKTGSNLILRAAAALPGISMLVPDKINPYTGEPVNLSTSARFVAFTNMIQPFRMVYDPQFDVEKEADRLGKRTSGGGSQISINGSTITLTGKELMRYQSVRGQFVDQLGQSMINSKDYLSAPDTNKVVNGIVVEEGKSSKLEDVYTNASRYAKIEYWLSKGGTYTTSNASEYAELRKLFGNKIKYVKQLKGTKFTK